jgi:GT2 family glycosyltransferase
VSVVDVVVVSYNSRDRLQACVIPLLDDPDVNVVVVDNASADDSLSVLRETRAHTIALDTNGGFGHGCNIGWRAGDAPYVLFVNPDARLDTDAVRTLVGVLETEPHVGAVGPKILNEDGSLDHSIRRFPRLRSTYAQAFFLHRVVPDATWTDETVHRADAYDSAAPVEWVSGACMLFRRSVLERLGGFDEGFFMYCEDKDLCRRTWDLGYEVRYEPTAVAGHEGGASAPRARLLPVLASSKIRYARKHEAATTAFAERTGIALQSLTHLVVSRGGRSRRAGHLQSLLVALGVREGGPPSATSSSNGAGAARPS